MGWKAPLGHITVNTKEGANIQVDLSELKDGILPDSSVDVSGPRIYSIKKGTEEQYLCINRFPYIDPNI